MSVLINDGACQWVPRENTGPMMGQYCMGALHAERCA